MPGEPGSEVRDVVEVADPRAVAAQNDPGDAARSEADARRVAAQIQRRERGVQRAGVRYRDDASLPTHPQIVEKRADPRRDSSKGFAAIGRIVRRGRRRRVAQAFVACDDLVPRQSFPGAERELA